jgi:hypothetical protein
MCVPFGSHDALSPRFSKEAGVFGWMAHVHIRSGMAFQQNGRETHSCVC